MNKLIIKFSQVFLLSLFIPLSACAADVTGKYDQGEVKYSIDFLTNGEFVVRNSRGEPVKEVQFPVTIKSVVRQHSIVEAEGSCFIFFNGRLYPC